MSLLPVSCLVAGAALLAGFGARQHLAAQPLILPSLLANRGFTAGLLLGLAFFAAVNGLAYVPFEVDQPGPQAWKRQRLVELGFGVPDWLRLVPVDFEAAENGARASGTPFLSFFSPPEMLALAREAGFTDARHVSADALNQRYFAGRADGLRMAREDLLVATT